MAPQDSSSIYYSARRFDAVNSVDRSPANTAEIVAAGALIWRVRDDIFEVLIIHRPNYDDWSWPKGKQDPGESLAAPRTSSTGPLSFPRALVPSPMRAKWTSCVG